MSISVLVADDSPTIRRRAQATLGEAGFDVHCVEDGEKAWEELEGGRQADVLLCDILMPRLDGYELCRRVKGDSRFSGLPVLLLRGTFEPWDEGKAHEAGADGFITKPFEPENLVATVRDVLEESAAERAEAPAAAPEAVAEPAPEPPPESAPAPTEPAAAAVPPEDPFGGGDESPGDGPFGGGEDNPLALGDAPSEPAAAVPEPAPPAPEPASPPPAAASPPTAAATPSAPSAVDVGSLDEATLDALAAKVAEKLAGEVLEKLAWDVVPEVAEALVRKRMIEIESKLQGG